MPEIDICNICNKKVDDNQDGLLCEKCTIWKHRDCMSMSARTYSRISSSTQPWICDGCQNGNKTKKKEQNKNYTIDDVMAKLDDMDGKYNALYKKFEDQLKINEKLQNELLEIKAKLNKKEQADLNNNLIIQGIPEGKNENLETVVKEIGSQLNVKIEDSFTVYRLGKVNSQKTRPIKVIFSKDEVKVNLMKSKKRVQLTTTDLGFSTNNKVFLNHDLTKANHELFMAAKEYKKTNNYKFLWISAGNIFLRKNEQSKVVLLENKDQLKK